MIIINIIGGLGNQMFQYAFAYALSQKRRTELKLDITGFNHYDLRSYKLHVYTLIEKFASKKEIHITKYASENLGQHLMRILKRKRKQMATTYYEEKYFHVNNNIFDVTGAGYFDGYWQSEKYFLEYRTELLKNFSLKNQLLEASEKFLHLIHATHSISVHIRRGDYVTNPSTNNFHGTCDVNYYRNAVSYIENFVDNPHYFIFSDDLEWAKDNLHFCQQKTFIEFENDAIDYEEMYLMSQCNHNIIANSSFSWWGAWLNQNSEKMVIAPKKWFNDPSINTSDLLPDSWIQL
jgi:hypothetical protein